jgi:nitroimidazol reductase NimA-like FMN-containing flavoprotein (pyridoxamine 5'-phosphate oxidase superfamily)
MEDRAMRRHEREVNDPKAIAQVLDAAEWGTLGLVSKEGRPLLVPLNFLHLEGRIYFHGAPAGEKMALLKTTGDATFLVVDAYSQIPSYAFDPERACPATQFFKSVLLYGRIAEVEDPHRKAEVLDALMRKLQPEGGYQPITAEDPMYRASVSGVAVLELTVDRVSAKYNLGQRLSPEQRSSVTGILEQRGCPVDHRTLGAMGDS